MHHKILSLPIIEYISDVRFVLLSQINKSAESVKKIFCEQFMNRTWVGPNSWMNEWMMHLYSALLCIVVPPKRFTIMWGGVSAQPPPVCSIHLDDATAATGQRPVRSPHTSYRWRGERVIEPIKCMLSPHTSYRWRGERVIEPIKCMLSPHTSYRWRGERESHRANQVYALTTHQLQVERRESHRANQVYALITHQLQVERRERES